MTRAPDPPYSMQDFSQWAAEFVRVYNRDVTNLQVNYQNMGAPTKTPFYTVSQLTTSNYSISGGPRPIVGRIAFGSGVSGFSHVVPVYADGTMWRVLYNNATVS